MWWVAVVLAANFSPFQVNELQTTAEYNKTKNLAFSVSAVETKATDDWKKLSGFSIDPAAEDLVAAGFSNQRSALETAFETTAFHPQHTQESFTGTLVRVYWSRLRALALKRGGKLIDSSTVSQLDPEKFLASIQFHSPTGELVAKSNPDGAQVTIDQTQQQELTNSSFIIAAGPHRVIISKGKQLRCDKEIRVSDSETVVVHCK